MLRTLGKAIVGTGSGISGWVIAGLDWDMLLRRGAVVAAIAVSAMSGLSAYMDFRRKRREEREAEEACRSCRRRSPRRPRARAWTAGDPDQ
jgi:hypothetical protein